MCYIYHNLSDFIIFFVVVVLTKSGIIQLDYPDLAPKSHSSWKDEDFPQLRTFQIKC